MYMYIKFTCERLWWSWSEMYILSTSDSVSCCTSTSLSGHPDNVCSYTYQREWAMYVYVEWGSAFQVQHMILMLQHPACKYICILHACIIIYMHVFCYMYMFDKHMYMHVFILAHVHIQTCTDACICICACTLYYCTRACIFTCMYMYYMWMYKVHTYCIQVHTCTCTFTYVHCSICSILPLT